MDDNKFLGQAKISKLLLKFSIPCITALLISALYNIVDQIFIGHGTADGLGAVGNAATSIVFPLTLVAVAFAGTFGDGTAAYMSICQGRKDTKDIHRSVGGSAVVTLLISLVLVALGYLFAEPILHLFGASDGNLFYAKQYFFIIISFFPVYMLGYMINSVIRADGSPAFAMLTTAAGAITNIILDPIFIFALNWGIRGAAWATIIGQLVTLALSVIYLMRTKTFKLQKQSWQISLENISNIAKLGISTFITQLSIVIISMVCNKMLASFGAKSIYGANDPLAIIGICMKVFTIVLSIAMGIIIGAQPILGYNIGAGNHNRVRETFKKCVSTVIIVGLAATFIFEIFPEFIINIFGSNSENPVAYMEFAILTFRIFLMLIMVTCLIKVISIFFQAVGEPAKATIVSLSRDIIIFVPLVIILPNITNNITGILWAAPIADLIGIVIAVCLVAKYFHVLNPSQAAKVVSSTKIAKSKSGIIITIAREHGSQGKKIGELVAQKLNIPYYYKELTMIAADESGLTQKFLEKVGNDEELSPEDLYLTSMPAKYAIEAQDAAIKEIAGRGSCVIVGRAADYVLREHQNLLRVFIYAPKDFRVKNIMSMYNDNKKTATKNLERSDKHRSEYYNLISGQKWGDPANYDLCIDASLGKEKVTDLICHLAENR